MAVFNKPTDLNKVWASSGSVVTPDDTKIAQGWIVEAPGHQTENYINKRHDTAIAHINQHGVPLWDNVTEYQGSLSWVLGSNGSIYFCKNTHTNTNPVTDLSETNWRKVLDGNTAITSPQISPFMLTVLSQTTASNAQTALGGTTTGKAVFTAVSASAARSAIGMTSVGSDVATATDQVAARTALGIPTASTAALGIARTADDSQVVAGTNNDSLFINPFRLLKGMQISLNPPSAPNAGPSGVTGYIVFPDWMQNVAIVWGKQVVGAGGSVAAYTFGTAIYHCWGTLGDNTFDNGDDKPAVRVFPSGNSIVVRNTDGGGIGVYWTGIGKL